MRLEGIPMFHVTVAVPALIPDTPSKLRRKTLEQVRTGKRNTLRLRVRIGFGLGPVEHLRAGEALYTTVTIRVSEKDVGFYENEGVWCSYIVHGTINNVPMRLVVDFKGYDIGPCRVMILQN